ncbi:EAL and HDOD domain-containing protein [Undibacterium fentianense]|uniref:HDOD domain-containing protein n=1 Tax=Undibacterium fentianense TaxID=2828728 RepID=A0A941ICI7_9BURK|nr:HDOD domain-containing protein [Undibacterium fentianense]MBR7798918.1 HDOD domain-containing protein [Undibacterium fentianense]
MMPIAKVLPIVNSQQKLVGLYPQFSTSDDQTSLQFLAQMSTLGLFEKLPGLFLFIDIADPMSLPGDFEKREFAKSVVLCILESCCNTKESQQRLKHWQQSGVRIIVDDFQSKAQLLWADTRGIGVDCTNGVPFHVQPWLFSLQSSQHLAKNLHSVQSFEQAHNAGFSFFSGDYAFSSSNHTRTADPSARARLLKLLGLVAKDADSRELEALFKQDPALSFMLFKLVSSAAFAQTVKVNSFIQAISLLGRRQLQRWLQLLLYARQHGQGNSLNPLMLRAAFRASFMEACIRGEGGDRDAQDAAFMVGMFSLLDLLFACPMWEILKPLSLPDEVRDALLERSGQLGAFLKLAEKADRIGTSNTAENSDDKRLPIDSYYEHLIQAYSWVNQVCQDM